MIQDLEQIEYRKGMLVTPFFLKNLRARFNAG